MPATAVRRPRAPRARRGFSLVEVVLVLAILSVSASMYAQTVASSRRLDPIGLENAIAAEAARIAIERLRAQPVEDLLALYDADPANDPGGPGTAPGPFFEVAGLAPLADGGPVGRYEFPLVDGELREDAVDDLLGLPRDLDGDGAVDGQDHRDDWLLLPFRVRIVWTPQGGAGSTREFEIYSMIPRL
jgi:prepilin-type N-terminal cleavage/methylation domain-containing protein